MLRLISIPGLKNPREHLMAVGIRSIRSIRSRRRLLERLTGALCLVLALAAASAAAHAGADAALPAIAAAAREDGARPTIVATPVRKLSSKACVRV